MASTRSTPKTLHVQLFGGPRLYSEGEEIGLSPNQAHLIGRVFGTQPRTLGRAEAIESLWPEENPRTAGRRLSQLLFSFGKKVGSPEVFAKGRGVIEGNHPHVSSDLDQFEKALESQDYSVCTSLLKRGFSVDLTHTANRTLSDWIVGREAELRHRLRLKADRQWTLCAQIEDWDGARKAAEALLDLKQSDETYLQRLLKAWARSGNLAEAQASFGEFELRNRDSGWKPSKETRILLNAISSSSPVLSGPLFLPDPGPQPESPFLGRMKEQKELRKALATAPNAEVRSILVSGEAGIGKTRLIREVLQRLPPDGQKVFSAESAELEKLIPLNPLVEVFAGPEAGAALRQLDEPWRTVLYGVMPRHYPESGPVPEAPQIQQESVPRRLFEAFHQLLLTLADEGPVILVFEDLQWADKTTLSVIGFLIRRWDHGNLQVVSSVREEEVRKHKELGTFLETLSAHVDHREFALSDLYPPDREALIQALAPEPLAEESVSQLQSLGGGNPFFLIELTLELLAGRLGIVATPQEPRPIPLSIRQVLERRLSQLSSEAELVLGSLAVHSRPLERSELTWIARLTEDQTLAGLDQLHEYRLVSTRLGKNSISHELVRQTVYHGLAESRQAWLHERVADHILRSRKDPPPDDLAVHFHHAGVSTRAKSYAAEAADRAQASGAVAETLRFLQIAREHSTDPDEVADLIGRMGHLNYLDKNLEEAVLLLELAASRFRRQGKLERALEAEVEKIDCLAQTGKLPGRDCLEELQISKGEASAAGFWKVFHQALEAEARQLDREGDLNGIRSVLGQASENMDKGTAAARCKARAVVALNIYFGSPTEGLVAAKEAVSIAKETLDSELLLHALNRLILALHYQGKLNTPEGREASAEAESRLGTCGDLALKFNLRMNKAVWHLEVGNLDQARVAFGAAEGTVRGTQARDSQAMLNLNLGELGIVSHDFSGARTAYESAAVLITVTSPHYFPTLVDAGLGLCALYSGDLEEARKRELGLPDFPEFWTFDPSLVTTFKARMLVKRQNLSSAVSLLDQVRESVRFRSVPAWIKLTLEEARIIRRTQPTKSAALAQHGSELAEELGLANRVEEFRRLKADLN